MNGLNDLYRTRVLSNLLDMLTKIQYLGHIIQHKNNYFQVTVKDTAESCRQLSFFTSHFSNREG